jgi:hypothetical protein
MDRRVLIAFSYSLPADVANPIDPKKEQWIYITLRQYDPETKTWTCFDRIGEVTPEREQADMNAMAIATLRFQGDCIE